MKCILPHFIWVLTVCQSIYPLTLVSSIQMAWKYIDQRSSYKNHFSSWKILKMQKSNTKAGKWMAIFLPTNYTHNKSNKPKFSYNNIGIKEQPQKCGYFWPNVLTNLSNSRDQDQNTYEPQHEIFNNVICGTSKASDQPAHTSSLIRAFASCLNILWIISYWLNVIWSFYA